MSTPGESLGAAHWPVEIRLKRAEKLLEAPDLKSRAEIPIAITEMDLAKKTAGGGDPPLQ